MNKFLKYLVFSQILLVSCIFAQSRTSASVEIRLKIVKNLSAEISQDEYIPEIDQNISPYDINSKREVIVRFNNNYKNESLSHTEIRDFKSSKINIFDDFGKLAQIVENQQLSLEKSLTNDNLKFLYQSNQSKNPQNFDPSVTIIY